MNELIFIIVVLVFLYLLFRAKATPDTDKWYDEDF